MAKIILIINSDLPMLKELQKFLERDQDITYYDEFHYIFITLKELIKIITTKNK